MVGAWVNHLYLPPVKSYKNAIIIFGTLTLIIMTFDIWFTWFAYLYFEIFKMLLGEPYNNLFR